MGFPAKRKLYKLVFEEDSDIHGLEITAKGLTLGERKAFLAKIPDVGGDAESVLAKLAYEIDFFVQHVVEWNLEDEDGNPQEISAEALGTLVDVIWIRKIMAAWSQATNGTSLDLKKESNDGNSTETTQSMEESLQMETLP